MMNKVRAFAAIMLLSFSTIVTADSVMATWDAPTNLVDGTLLDTTDITGYLLKYQVDNGEEVVLELDNSGTAVIEAVEGVWVLSVATKTSWANSEYTSPISLSVGEIEKADPQAPTNLTVSILCDVENKCTMEIVR